MEHAYWGPGFSSADCKLTLEGKPVRARQLADSEMPATVAKLLSEGNLIARFQGRMEWGPRALGNRSFLADPRMANMQEVINRKIKLREPFRPFAPSMLEEDAAPIIGYAKGSPYMLLVFPVNHGWENRIPAVVHVDRTARPQTVSKRANPGYWNLIHEFKKITGIPLLLNTSFNIQEPIVCTPEHALNTFLNSGVDYLVLEDYLVQKI
jgi:carbamoyltransferase